MASKAGLLLCALARLTPVLLVAVILWMIWQRTPAVPVWDEWEMTELVQKRSQGTLNLQDIWGFYVHNEHRIVISRLLSLLIIEITGWNRQVQMTFNLALVALTAGMLYRCVRWTLGPTRLSVFLLLPISLLLFSLARFASWFQPVTDKIPTAFGVVLCFWALARTPVSPGRFALAIVGALVASLSSFGGLIVWGAFAPAVLLTGWKRLLVWIGVALAIVIPYLAGFPSGTLTTDYTREASVTPRLGETIRYTVALLGSAVGYPNLQWAMAFGALSIALIAANTALFWFLEGRNARRWELLTTWGGIALFALGSAGAVALGRGPGFGLGSAIDSRFHTFSSLWWCVVFVLAATIGGSLAAAQSSPDRRTRTLAQVMMGVNVAALSLAIAGAILANVAGFVGSSAGQQRLQEHQHCILRYEQAADECLALFHWDPSLTRSRSAYLAERGLSIFREEGPAALSR